MNGSTSTGPGRTCRRALGVERAAGEAGYGVSIVSLREPNPRAFTDALQRLVGQSVEGIVLIAPQDQAAHEVFDAYDDVPVVTPSAFETGEHKPIMLDSVEGSRIATRHLVELGQTGIAPYDRRMSRATVVDQSDLPIELDGSAVEFEGRDHGGSVSVILVSTDEDGAGPRLHRHPYDETFVIRGGQALFTVGDQELVGRAGQIIVVPAQVPHKFAKTGSERLEMTDVHASPVFITEWLE